MSERDCKMKLVGKKHTLVLFPDELSMNHTYIINEGGSFVDDAGNLRNAEDFNWESPERRVNPQLNTEYPKAVKPFEVNSQGGQKGTSGKPMMSLLHRDLPTTLLGVAEVLTYGAEKYEAGNWKLVEADKYWDAFYRHINALHRGEEVDEESGMNHIDHALTDLMFIRELTYGNKA